MVFLVEFIPHLLQSDNYSFYGEIILVFFLVKRTSPLFYFVSLGLVEKQKEKGAFFFFFFFFFLLNKGDVQTLLMVQG